MTREALLALLRRRAADAGAIAAEALERRDLVGFERMKARAEAFEIAASDAAELPPDSAMTYEQLASMLGEIGFEVDGSRDAAVLRCVECGRVHGRHWATCSKSDGRRRGA